jgi:two-component system sensor kinase FixL
MIGRAFIVPPGDALAATEPPLSASASGAAPEHSDLLVEQLMSIARVSALTEMASGIAHVMNQPLGAIATFAQAGERLLERPLPDVARALEVLKHISSEALQAGENLRRIRRLFDVPAAEGALCDVGGLIAEIRPLLESMARRAGADLAIDVPADLPVVSLDRLRVQHVLLALVQNALEASEGGPRPRVELHAAADRYALMFEVLDSGPGVPNSIHDQVFRPFFTTKAHGTGLGLASACGIIQAHQGSIGFENRASGGSRFWCRLPLAV